jgi:fatty-acyl-CoA synthase
MTVDISPIPHLARHARFHSEKTAIIYEDVTFSYADFFESVGRLAAALRADGVGTGDRVAYYGLNSPTFLRLYFAAAWIGATFIPVNFRLAGPEVRALIEDSRPDVLIAEPERAAVVDAFIDDLSVRTLLLVDDDATLAEPVDLAGHWTPLTAFLASVSDTVPPVARHDDDLAALLYTSGTTGRPKGVMLSHGNVWWNWVNVDSVVDTRVGDVSLAVSPLFHIGGLNALTLRTLTRGGTLVIRRTFDPGQTLRDLVELKVNSMFVVPAILAAVQRQPGFADADLSELRSTIVAGAPVPPALIAHYADKGVLLQQAWGLTETAPFATYLEAGRTAEKLGSCGIPMAYSKVQVVDVATLEPIAEPGRSGELWVSGPNVAAGYWNNPEASAAAFTPDGWFRTGDIGYVDDEGFFFIVDRLKDMIISGGENVYPAELENVLNAHPEVLDVAVIGVPDERWGELVCAVVSFTDDGGSLTLEDVRAFASEQLARYKLPNRLVKMESIPRNGAGKLDKPLIRKLVAELETVQDGDGSHAPFTEAVRVQTSLTN